VSNESSNLIVAAFNLYYIVIKHQSLQLTKYTQLQIAKALYITHIHTQPAFPTHPCHLRNNIQSFFVITLSSSSSSHQLPVAVGGYAVVDRLSGKRPSPPGALDEGTARVYSANPLSNKLGRGREGPVAHNRPPLSGRRILVLHFLINRS